jgi:ssDNA-binding Zn-finger/Zn-ribbon topoisomerase 1
MAIPVFLVANTNPICPQCGSPMKKREGTYGDFWGCTQYPECRGIRSMSQCPVCGNFLFKSGSSLYCDECNEHVFAGGD